VDQHNQSPQKIKTDKHKTKQALSNAQPLTKAHLTDTVKG